MKRILERVKIGLNFKEDLPPPYEENIARDLSRPDEENPPHNNEDNCQVFDLLAACSISDNRDLSESESSRCTNSDQVMGLKHSTPWSSRHRSKISLTWVLREQSDIKKYASQERRRFYEDFRAKTCNGDVNNRLEDHPRWNRNSSQGNRSAWNKDSSNQNSSVWNRNDPVPNCSAWNRNSSKASAARNKNSSPVWNRESGQTKGTSRIVGRNALYNDTRVGRSETCSEATSAEVCASERGRRRHRRRRKKSDGVFGYEIKNIDGFLAEASIERPGNIPVVLSCASTLYQTGAGAQREMPLPLGTVVNAVFKKQAWLYVQTPHAEEGYVQYSACLPLGILPTDKANSPWHKTPCWESSTDIYPQPCGNMTDAEKEDLRGRSRSESGYRVKANRSRLKSKSVCGEEAFDKLYLRATSVCSQKIFASDVDSDGDRATSQPRKQRYETDCKSTRHTLLVISRDYAGSAAANTLSVRQGEVVVLPAGRTDVDAEWFYVRTRTGGEGFIPAEIAGHGYI